MNCFVPKALETLAHTLLVNSNEFSWYPHVLGLLVQLIKHLLDLVRS